MPGDRHLDLGMRELLREDRKHLLRLLANKGHEARWGLWWYPPFLCVALFRASQWLASRRYRLLARITYQANLLLTGADLDPAARIGGGLVVLSPAAVSVTGTAGCNLVLGPMTGLGIGPSVEDIGAGPGRPLLGDDVELAALSGVLGPVRVGNRVHIGPCCAVTQDVPDDSVVRPHPPRFMRPTGSP